MRNVQPKMGVYGWLALAALDLAHVTARTTSALVRLYERLLHREAEHQRRQSWRVTSWEACAWEPQCVKLTRAIEKARKERA